MAKAKTINRHLVEVLGFRKALNVSTMLTLYTVFMQFEGRPPSMEELAQETAYSLGHVYRIMADFKQAFPDEQDPARICGEILENLQEAPSAKGLGAIPLAQIGL